MHRDRALSRSQDGGDGGAHDVVAVPVAVAVAVAVARRLGARILKHIERRVKAMELKSTFVLTACTMHRFLKPGFPAGQPRLPEARKRKYDWDRQWRVLSRKFYAHARKTHEEHKIPRAC